MKPIGLTTTPRTPAPASAARWSLMSGSSHGTCGGPDRDCHTRSQADPGRGRRGDQRRGLAQLGE